MITVTFTKILIPPGAILTPTPFTLSYKAYSDANYTVIATNVYVDLDGRILSSPLPSITIDESDLYILVSVNDYCGASYEQTLDITDPNLYKWIPDDTYCEQTNPLNLTKTVTGFADPYNVGYDEITGRMYAVDASAITSSSNIYWFDASTINVAGDVTPVGSLNYAALASVIDSEGRFIYISGANTGGLKAYNIATNTVTSVPFGSDAPYARLTLEKFGDTIICLDTPSLSVYLIDAPTLTISSSIPYSSIPNYTQYFSTGTIVLLVKGNWWVLASQGSGLGVPAGTIGVYSPDFTTLLYTISLPGQALWTNSAYWRTADIFGDNLFVYDAGSNQLVTVNITTEIADSIYTFTNREGKTNSFMSVIEDVVTHEIYLSGVYTNDANTDFAPIQITYKLDSGTFLPITIYPDITYGTPLVRKGSTDVLVGTYGGVRVYPTNPPGASTDGTINIFSKSGTGDNTQYVVVLTLQKVYIPTETPTGDTKPNVIGQPDYIPKYLDPTQCPPTYTYTCPDVNVTITGINAQYEYSFAASTYTNPSIAAIVLEQVDAVTSAILVNTSFPVNAYQNGVLTKSGPNTNNVNLLFKDVYGATITSCTTFFSIP